MDAHKAGIADIFTSMTLIEVPFFQRPYVWKEDLWERFLEDMEYVTKTNKTHFFGSIILKDAGKAPAGVNYVTKKTIVDGQQRLTTFLIFMKVLCLKNGQTDLYNFNFKNMNKDIKLLHSKCDKEAFDKIVSADNAVEIDNPEPASQIISAFNFFVNNIDESKLDNMTILSNIQFVKIDLDSDEDEQQIFDTINSLGVDLTTAELLKNYFFNRESIKEYEEKWVGVFEKDDDAKIYWNTEIETGRVKKAMIDIFFEAYFEIFVQDKKYGISNEDKIAYARVDELAQSYKHFINNYCNGDKQVILKGLKDYATCFMHTFRPDYCNMEIPGTAGIERLNVVIFGLKNSTMIPYVLYATKNIYDKEELNRIYGLLESYTMRRTIIHATSKNYNKFYTTLIFNSILDYESLKDRLLSSQEESSYVPSDEDVKEGFEKSRLVNLQTKGIIYLIESYIHPSKYAANSLLGFNTYSLEHLMPKKWRNNWEPCATEEDERNRDFKLLTLGNLAIIPQALNSSIRDADWQTKRAGKGANKPGLDRCAGGLQTMIDVLQKDTWSEDDIEERAEWLYEKAKEVWKIDD